MSDLEKATNRNISLSEKEWQEIDDLADLWGLKRSVTLRLIYNEWKQFRATSQLGTKAPVPSPAKVIAGHEQPEPCAA